MEGHLDSTTNNEVKCGRKMMPKTNMRTGWTRHKKIIRRHKFRTKWGPETCEQLGSPWCRRNPQLLVEALRECSCTTGGNFPDGTLGSLWLTWLLHKGNNRSDVIKMKGNLVVDYIITMQARKKRRNISVVWVDYKKAFDSISHSWLMKVLKMQGMA